MIAAWSFYNYSNKLFKFLRISDILLCLPGIAPLYRVGSYSLWVPHMIAGRDVPSSQVGRFPARVF